MSPVAAHPPPRYPSPLQAATSRSRKRGWWLAVGGCAAAIFILSVVPVPEGPSVPYLDKAVHLCEYLLFSWLLAHAIRATQLTARDYLWLVWIYATSYGLVIEIIQGLIPWRSADLLDAVANALGAALGAWGSQHLPRRSG